MADLDLDVRLASRTTASYTPWTRGERTGGLLVERPEGEATRASFRELTGGDEEYAAWQAFYAEVGRLRRGRGAHPDAAAPPRARRARAGRRADLEGGRRAEPLGRAITARFTDDTVRGVVATDALIGTFASMDDPSLIQNRCFLYHLIGNGTGEWRVPVGGMGAVTDAPRQGRRRGRRRDRHRGRRQRHRPRPRRRRGRPATTVSRAALGHRPPGAVRRGAVGAADPARRGRGRRDQAGRLPAQDQLPPRPAPRAALRRRPGGRLRRARSTSPRTTPSSRGRTPPRPAARCPTRCRARSTATASPTPRSSATGPARRTR